MKSDEVKEMENFKSGNIVFMEIAANRYQEMTKAGKQIYFSLLAVRLQLPSNFKGRFFSNC